MGKCTSIDTAAVVGGSSLLDTVAFSQQSLSISGIAPSQIGITNPHRQLDQMGCEEDLDVLAKGLPNLL